MELKIIISGKIGETIVMRAYHELRKKIVDFFYSPPYNEIRAPIENIVEGYKQTRYGNN